MASSSPGAAGLLDEHRELYDVLNVPAVHPDKHRDPDVRATATTQFNRLREAYEVLSHPELRHIYDHYGVTGINAGRELSQPLTMLAEVKRQVERMQAQAQRQALEARLGYNSTVLFGFSAAHLLDRYSRYPPNTSPFPELTQTVINVAMHAPLSQKNTLIFGGSAMVRRGLGGGGMLAGFRRQCSPVSSLEVSAQLGTRAIIQLYARRQLSAHSSGSIMFTLNPRDLSNGLTLSINRQLTNHTFGQMSWSLGMDPGIAMNVSRKGVTRVVAGDLRIGLTSMGVGGSYTQQLSPKSSTKVSAKVGSTGVEMELGASHQLSEHSSGGVALVIGLQGVSMRFRYTRIGQKFIIPVLLSPALHWQVVLGSLVGPVTLFAILKRFFLDPIAKGRQDRKQREVAAREAAMVRDARETAAANAALLRPAAARQTAAEEACNGLIIVEAVYGDLVSDRASDAHEGEETLPRWIDVTIPLRFRVQNSRLQLHESVQKPGIMGFCDPNPGAPKALRIKYLHRGRSRFPTSRAFGYPMQRIGCLMMNSPQDE
eukprot:jgi/Chlat1/8799/Chrsp90S08139